MRGPTMLAFVIPLIHPRAAREWKAVLARLEETVRSLHSCASDGNAFSVLVANEGAELPPLPDSVHVERVAMPPPAVSVFLGESPEEERRLVKQLDTGTKTMIGAMRARDLGAHYVMRVDADDLVSVRLPGFVREHAGAAGWYVHEGWVLPVGGRVAYRLPGFDRACGTCLVARTDLLDLPAAVGERSPDHIRRWFGSHKHLRDDLRAKGETLAPLPFPAAVYRIGHGENIRGKTSLRDEYFRLSRLRRSPLEYLRRIRRLQRFGPPLWAEFHGGSRPA